MEWLLAPVDPGRAHDVGVLLSWHARFMVLAWAFLVPLGVLVARFLKITPRQDWPAVLDNRFWWRSHLLLQNVAVALMLIAVALILMAPRHAHQSGVHLWFGWTVVLLGAVQILGGLLRGTKGGPTAPAPDGSLRGDHYDMSPRRVAFEIVHKTAGYAALLISVVAIATGLWQANAPRWFWGVIAGWWIILFAAFTLFQRRGMASDTYEAIWGPDPKLPGNRRRPIGIGIRRRTGGGRTGKAPGS